MKHFAIPLYISILSLLAACQNSGEIIDMNNSTTFKYTNHLIDESSPYLLQHAHNPVNWYPWGEEALEKAKRENKLIIISIGYAACHWCHVMEEESFEDEEVARFMNDNFIAIKVDREERPDIDRIYMDAVQLLTGGGGWPLNCIALPDGRPIYGGTYFPKEDWLSVLSQVQNYVKDNPEKAEEQAAALTQGVQDAGIILASHEVSSFSLKDLDTLFSAWQPLIDPVNGGMNGAPKFPMPGSYQYLLHYNSLTGNQIALDTVHKSLTKMAEGGIYDQIGGGFARYSVDALWKVPHFEKMLYDNAQLVSLYSKAYQKIENPLFATVVRETIDFIDRELTSEEGAFFSSLDADSEGEEGKFYVWTNEELENILGRRYEEISRYYNVTSSGNWEKGKNILHITGQNEIPADLDKIKAKLLKERSKRIRPGLDDKILTSWNALMIKAYVDAYRIFDEDDYLVRAEKAADFILKNVKMEDGRLNRNYKNGRSSINAFLDDYSFAIEAFISLYEATFYEKWLFAAEELTKYVLAHFSNNNNGMFYYTSDLDPELIVRKTEVIDNVIYSSNSQMAKNLFMLGHYFYRDDYINRAEAMLNNVKSSAVKGAMHFANWDILMAWMAKGVYEVSILGEDYKRIRKELDKHYLPNVFISGGKSEGSLELLKYKLVEGETLIYVCRDKACLKPVFSVEEALEQFF